MVNTSAKGWRKERECRKLLEQDGFTIVFKSIRWRYGTLDFAKLFDTVAVKNADGEAIWIFISNKHYGSAQTKFPEHQQKIMEFKEKFCPKGCLHMIFELWIWHKPAYSGRGASRRWNNAKWEIIKL